MPSFKLRPTLVISLVLLTLIQGSITQAQNRGGPDMSRRFFIRGILSAGAASTVVSPNAVLSRAADLAGYDLSNTDVFGFMDTIFEGNSNANGIIDVENYLSEMRALARAAGPHVRQIVLGEVARTESYLSQIKKISNLGQTPGSSLSTTEIENLKTEIKTPDGQRVLTQLNPDSTGYNMFLVRGMLPPPLIRTINHGLAFTGSMSDFLGFSDLLLVNDYGKIMAALQAKTEPGSRLHIMADSFLEMFDTSESRGIPGYRNTPALLCRNIFAD